MDEGNLIEGIIKNITEYGVFIDLGGIDGLLHITDMSWGRVNHPSEMFSMVIQRASVKQIAAKRNCAIPKKINNSFDFLRSIFSRVLSFLFTQ